MTRTVSFVDEVKHPGTAAVTADRCAACGCELGIYDLVCLLCGRKLKLIPPADHLTSHARELRGIAAGAIANAMTSMVSGRKMGVRFRLAESLLDSAQQAAIRENFPVALELASRSGQEVETQISAFDALQARLRKARHLMDAAREVGADLGEAEQLFELARAAGDAGDYRGALRYAIKAAHRVAERRSGVTAWKVEIGDWLR
jgi:hypothetical protein